MFDRVGIDRGVAIQDLLIGSALVQGGACRKALRPLRQALEFMRQIGDEMLEARTLLRLGEALLGAGGPDEADAAAKEALSVVERLGFRGERAEAFELLARVAEAAGDVGESRSKWRKAHEIYRDMGHPRAEEISSILVRLELGLPLTG
jgi:tetratricopeptide (TPR) repeat protein